jgi:crossover junction endodeoxyribonuclease RusA
MTGTAKIVLPWTAPPLSLNDGGATRGARMAKARIIAKIRGDVANLARKAGLPKGVAYAVITLHYRPRDNRRRDSVNLAPTYKAVVDGLTPQKVVKTKTGFKVHAGYGFVNDDSTREVSTPEPVIHQSERGMPGALWLEITWTDEEV